MRPLARFGSTLLAALAFTGVLSWQDASAITMKLGGYVVSPLATPTLLSSGFRMGPDGNLYLHSLSSSSIHRISPGGTESPWSSAPVRSLALLPGGGAVGTGSTACSCLVRIEPNGSFTTFAKDSILWDHVASAGNGNVFATGRTPATSGYGAAVYEVDPLTGDRTLLAGTSYFLDFSGLATGADGLPYVIRNDPYPTNVLARVEGGSLVTIGSLPHHGHDLVSGGGSLFWYRTSWDYGSGYPIGEIWAIDSSNGVGSLLAQTSWVDATFWGVEYDPVSHKLFVGDPSHRLLQPNRVLQTVSGGLLPTRTVTWGSVKARYRGEAAPTPDAER